MARRKLEYSVTEGRDKGKLFILTEMPASRAERWAMRAAMAAISAGVELPEGIEFQGMAGIAQAGITAFAKIPFDVAGPLLDEMFGCVQFVPDPTNRSIVRDLIEDDIEDVATRFKLRMELFKLHIGFFDNAA